MDVVEMLIGFASNESLHALGYMTHGSDDGEAGEGDVEVCRYGDKGIIEL